MADEYVVACQCGKRYRVSSFAFGMTSQCRQCGASLTVGPENAKPLERKAKAASTPLASAPASPQAAGTDPPAADPAECARCGRPFKGDWDKQRIEGGVICYNCSNLAVGGMPERFHAEAAARAAQSDVPVRTAPNPYATLAEEQAEKRADEPPPLFLGLRTDTVQFKAVVMALALLTVGGTFFLVTTEGVEVPTEVGSVVREEPAADVESIGPGLARTLMVIDVLLSCAAAVGALYLAMRVVDDLPTGNLGNDLFIASYQMIPIAAMWYFGGWLLGIPVIFFLMKFVFDLRFLTMVYTAVFAFFLVILAQAAKAGIGAGLYAIFY